MLPGGQETIADLGFPPSPGLRWTGQNADSGEGSETTQGRGAMGGWHQEVRSRTNTTRGGQEVRGLMIT